MRSGVAHAAQQRLLDSTLSDLESVNPNLEFSAGFTARCSADWTAVRDRTLPAAGAVDLGLFRREESNFQHLEEPSCVGRLSLTDCTELVNRFSGVSSVQREFRRRSSSRILFVSFSWMTHCFNVIFLLQPEQRASIFSCEVLFQPFTEHSQRF